MLLRRTHHRHMPQKATLYTVVYGSVSVRYLAFVIVVFFLAHPAVPVFASEEAPSSESESSSESSEATSASEESSGDTSSAEQSNSADEESGQESTQEEATIIADENDTEELNDGEFDSEEVVGSDTSDLSDTTTTDSTSSSQATVSAPVSTDKSTSSSVGVSAGTSTPSESSTGTVATTEPRSTTTPIATSSSTQTATTTHSTSTQNVPSTSTTTEVTETPEQEVVDPPDIVPQPESEEESSTTTDSEDEDVSTPDTGATSSEQHVYEAVNTVTNANNRYQFGEAECVSVGDGAFYCSKENQSTISRDNEAFARADADGDREIFLLEDGNERQLTHNTYEDDAPYYDESSKQVVFHRLIEGRYQIMRHDLDSGDEVQLTDSRENNMEPMQLNGALVWQRWIDDNWEVMLYENKDTVRLTDNDYHDVAPNVRDGYVMWHTTNEAGEKLLSVYDIETQISSTIADPDGGHVENPRFVLVYDTKYENGDIVTKEYDPKTGEVRPIGTDPAPLPSPIPEPESTGEAAALVNTKSPTRSETGEEYDDIVTPDTSATTSTSTDVTGVDLNMATSTTLELTDYDLIVEPKASTTNAVNQSSSSTPQQS